VSGRRLVIATRSRHKLEELRELLLLPGVELLSLDDVGVADEAEEPHETFVENAVEKARFFAPRTGLPTLADDSGLEVDALHGGPGVRTRRYAGESATDDENNTKLLDALAGLPPDRRTARYRCVLVYLDPSAAPPGEPLVTRGTLEGRITKAPRGKAGFGYDPIFEPLAEPVGGRTVAEMTAAEKNAISHRGEAARTMRTALRELGY
jgi:XTP/dITP diphosphohydrolase